MSPMAAPPLVLELLRGGDARTQAGEQKDNTPPAEQKMMPASGSVEPEQASIEPPINAEPRTTANQRRSDTSDRKPTVSGLKPTFTLNSGRVAQQIAALDDRRRQELGDSRTRHLNNVGAPSSAESAYLAMWRRKCERLGSNNYPSGNLQGELTLKVVIHQTGRLLEVSLLRSSGHPALDDAAVATVRQASPYQPFNVEMRKRYDRLSFTRTWQFSRRSASIN